MPAQILPASTAEYVRSGRALSRNALLAVKRQWRKMGEDFDAGWLRVGPRLIAILDEAQYRSALAAQVYIPAVLADTGQDAEDELYRFATAAIVGTSGDGLSTASLAYEAVIRAKTRIGQGYTVPQALASGDAFLSSSVPTVLADTRRTVEKVGMGSRRVSGYVRALTPPSCGRCIILAGKWSRTSEGFERHPRCDCTTIPAAESIAGDMMVDPHAYLDELSDDDLRKALGSEANAKAWRDGADVNQLVNAYRRGGDVRSAQVYGRNVKYTTEGTTRRGVAYRAMSNAGYTKRARDVRDGRYRRTQVPRLMPESIYQVAESQADAERLLRLYGWIL